MRTRKGERGREGEEGGEGGEGEKGERLRVRTTNAVIMDVRTGPEDHARS